jgi:hypothetical protein
LNKKSIAWKICTHSESESSRSIEIKMNDGKKIIEIKRKDTPVTLFIPVQQLYGTNGAGLGMYFALTDQFMFGWIKAKERLLFGRLDNNREIIRGIISSD